MLERYAVKVARTVLRGGEGGNILSLPDQEVRETLNEKVPCLAKGSGTFSQCEQWII